MSTSVHTSDAMARRLAKRRSAERRFRAYGIVAITLAVLPLATLFTSIIGNGYTAFQQTYIELEVTWDPEVLGIGERSGLEGAVGRELSRPGQEDDAGHVPGREGAQGQAHAVRRS